MFAECARLKKSKVTTVSQFFSENTILSDCMKRGSDKKKRLTHLDGYTNFDCMRAPRATAQRGSR